MEMTIARLRSYRGIRSDIAEIKLEIESLYFPISSPKWTDESHGTTPGDPTVAALSRIRFLRRKIEILEAEGKEIENWIDSLEDHELRAIIRAHYVNNKTWEQCTRDILNYQFSDTAKKRVYRYFGL